jgi:hypothetical protein
MNTIATILSFASGFVLMRYHGTPPTILATSLAINASLAPLTAIVASRRGRSALLWLAVGLALGMWALAYVLLRHPRHNGRTEQPTEPPFPPTSDAA